MDQLVGKTLGQYQIISELGRGGMAVVYKAYQPALQRFVAIKVLPPQLSLDPDFIRRFQHEAVAAARLKHPNIVTIYDVGAADGVNYIVMELVEGQSLASVILHEGAVRPERVTNIIAQVASALDYAHSQSFVHRDIKPSNIMLGANDHVTLMDFGIAKAMSGTQLTQTGAIIGTPEYMSPEQVRGLPVDHRADIYSLGIVTYEMLAGQVPFSGDTASVLYKQAHELPPPIRSRAVHVSPAIARALDRVLVKDSAQRFPTAGAFARALAGAEPMAASATFSPPLPPMASVDAAQPVASRPGRPVWVIWALGGVVATALVCMTALSVVVIAGLPGKKPTPTTSLVLAQAPTATLTSAMSATPAMIAAAPQPTAVASPSPTQTPSPTPTFTPVCPSVTGPFASLWEPVKDKLGCATSGAHDTWMAEEPFQKGHMFWRQDNDQIYVLYNGDGWGVYPNPWHDGDPHETCSSGSPVTAVRGFGKVWCTVTAVRTGLGNAMSDEYGYNGTVQDFARGLILRVDSGQTYAVYTGDGWEVK